MMNAIEFILIVVPSMNISQRIFSPVSSGLPMIQPGCDCGGYMKQEVDLRTATQTNS